MFVKELLCVFEKRLNNVLSNEENLEYAWILICYTNHTKGCHALKIVSNLKART